MSRLSDPFHMLKNCAKNVSRMGGNVCLRVSETGHELQVMAQTLVATA